MATKKKKQQQVEIDHNDIISFKDIASSGRISMPTLNRYRHQGLASFMWGRHRCTTNAKLNEFLMLKQQKESA